MKQKKVPSNSGKISLNDLKDVRQVEYHGDTLPDDEAIALKVSEAGFTFDFLWRPAPSRNALFVFFSGDAIRSKNDPPVFQRWSWARHFPGNCLFVSDPSLYLDKGLGLAWYGGTSRIDPLDIISRVIRRICDQKRIPIANVFSYGSSGGGFAALRLLTVIEEMGAIAINPQTVVTNYRNGMVEKYLRVCFGGLSRQEALDQYPERLSLLHHIEALKRRRIIYLQNVQDEHHYDVHYLPFCKAMGCDPEANESDGNFRRLLFAHEGGHAKAETPEVFAKAMQIAFSSDPAPSNWTEFG
ncbi:hypothetical protein [Rhizobium sp. GN54]|uniref:hypothetical protein n=1 Tax=Rhizobium sp. GN54 TaxID=2898150 RepID=UPI001E5384C2|nr:hypothetical protein [Rhizobium sp. GN54]MCD2183557.1 hypothetical protein [Rhizobium sp. GN54]